MRQLKEIKDDSYSLDILKEISNIGSGNAVTALSKMISGKIDMDVPNIMVLDFNKVAEVLGGEENIIVGIYLGLERDLVGNIMFALDLESAKNLSNLLYPRERQGDDLDEMDLSVLSEVGNILASSYVNSLAQLINMNIAITIPSLAVDMAGAILSVPAIQFGMISDKALMIETMFNQDEQSVTGNFFLLPDLDSYDKLLKALGAM